MRHSSWSHNQLTLDIGQRKPQKLIFLSTNSGGNDFELNTISFRCFVVYLALTTLNQVLFESNISKNKKSLNIENIKYETGNYDLRVHNLCIKFHFILKVNFLYIDAENTTNMIADRYSALHQRVLRDPRNH